MPDDNLALWNRHRTPHKDALKPYVGRGGFRGTAIDPMWAIRAATEEWGPMGLAWGFNVVDDKITTLADSWVLHTVDIELWFDDTITKLPSTGSTWLVSPKNDGTLLCDDEAPKKSRTDALSKALSWLGFGADIYMGMHDGSKYRDFRADNNPQSNDNKEQSPQPSKGTFDAIAKNRERAIAVGGEEEYKAWHFRLLSNWYHVASEDQLSIVTKDGKPFDQAAGFAQHQRTWISDHKE